jgi:hypothetical protein
VAVTPDVRLVIDELVLEGVQPDDPVVEESLARAVAPALAAHGLEGQTGQVTSGVVAAVGQEAAR